MNYVHPSPTGGVFVGFSLPSLSGTASGGLSLFLAGHGASSGGISLFAKGFDSRNLQASLYVAGSVGNTQMIAVTTLFVQNNQVNSVGLPLLTWGYNESAVSTIAGFTGRLGDPSPNDVYTVLGRTVLGYQQKMASRSCSLFMVGTANSGMYDFAPLYIGSLGTGNRGVTLLEWGHVPFSGGTSLFILPPPPVRHMSLFLQANDIPTFATGVPLSIDGGRVFGGSGLVHSTTLHTYADDSGNVQNRHMPLFLSTSDRDGTVRNMNLWVGGGRRLAAGSVNLTVANLQSGVPYSTTLFVQGDGETDGALPLNRGMNLFLRRAPAASLPLLISGPGVTDFSSVYLTVPGHATSLAGTTLVVPSAIGGDTNATKLYTHGY